MLSIKHDPEPSDLPISSVFSLSSFIKIHEPTSLLCYITKTSIREQHTTSFVFDTVLWGRGIAVESAYQRGKCCTIC